MKIKSNCMLTEFYDTNSYAKRLMSFLKSDDEIKAFRIHHANGVPDEE